MDLSTRWAGPELIDGSVDSRAELLQSFADIAMANRWFGGTAAVRAALRGHRPRRVLDVGTGIADIPRALLRRFPHAQIVGLDTNASLVASAVARERLQLVLGDGRALPFPDAAFDVVMCNLTLHHLAPDEAVALLKEMRRVSAKRVIVTDLVRSPLAYIATWLFTRLFTHNRLTRHDGPVSVRRAYTRSEALELAKRAGWKNPKVRGFAFIRMILSDDQY